jgi:cobalt transporter subunit CbtB
MTREPGDLPAASTLARPRVEGAWGMEMSNLPTNATLGAKQAAAALTLSRTVPIFAAFLLGVFIVGGVGFSHIEAVHNAAHDYRHSMSFPCH